MMRVTKKLYALLIAGMMAVSLAGCQSTGNSSNSGNAQSEQSSKGSTNSSTKTVSSDNIPDFSGNMTVAVDNNNPDFTSKDLTTNPTSLTADLTQRKMSGGGSVCWKRYHAKRKTRSDRYGKINRMAYSKIQ